MAANIFVIAEQNEGQIRRVSLEILSELSRQGVPATAVLLGSSGQASAAEKLNSSGASKVVFLEHAELERYSTEGFATALFQYLKPLNPTAILTGATSAGKDWMPRLAAKFSVGMASDCTDLKVDGDKLSVRRPVFAGKCTKAVQFTGAPAVVTVRPNVFPVSPGKGTASVEKVAANPGTIRAKIVEVKASATKKVDLTESDVIISGGRSLKSADNFKILFECAETIGAGVGASRAAVDAGYASHEMQVGQTGKTVSPKLYIACGISGAIQHLAGMRTSKVIVAINKDPEAPIFQRADYGIVGDLFEVVPLLTKEFKALKAHS
jgi:electron transfer flavoprotein alpha subunit